MGSLAPRRAGISKSQEFIIYLFILLIVQVNYNNIYNSYFVIRTGLFIFVNLVVYLLASLEKPFVILLVIPTRQVGAPLQTAIKCCHSK